MRDDNSARRSAHLVFRCRKLLLKCGDGGKTAAAECLEARAELADRCVVAGAERSRTALVRLEQLCLGPGGGLAVAEQRLRV